MYLFCQQNKIKQNKNLQTIMIPNYIHVFLNRYVKIMAFLFQIKYILFMIFKDKGYSKIIKTKAQCITRFFTKMFCFFKGHKQTGNILLRRISVICNYINWEEFNRYSNKKRILTALFEYWFPQTTLQKLFLNSVYFNIFYT